MECHECGATISDKAADCPHCGASVRDLSGGDGTDDHRDDAPTGDARQGDAEAEAETGTETETEAGAGTETRTETGTESVGGTETERDEPSVPGAGSGDATTEESATGTTTDESPAETAAEVDDDESTAADSGEPGGPATGTDTETGWEAAGPPPDEQGDAVETGGGAGADVDDQETNIGDQETTVGEASEFGSHDTGVDDSGFGGGTDTGGREPEIPDRTGETGGAGTDADTGRDSSGGTSETVSISEGVRELPFLTGPIAGLVTGAVLTVLSVVVAVLIPGSGFDTVSLGALVLLDLHFATSFHVTPGLFGMFDIVEPPASSLGLLYLLPGLFCYTAAKFVAAYNVDETTPLPVAGAAGGLVAVGYFPVMLVALFLAPVSGAPSVSLPVAILLGGIAYPVFFGFLGGLAAGAFSSSERRVGTLYGVVAFFLMAIGAFVVTLPALEAGDVGLLPQVHASLFTIVSANGFSLGGAGTGALVLLGYPLVGGVVFAAGFLRAWNASDVEEPLRGAAKGLSPVATYFTLLGVVATLLPILADEYVAGELGFGFAATTLVQGLVLPDLATIGRYVSVVFVGTLVYAIFLGGIGGAVAGGARYALSDEN